MSEQQKIYLKKQKRYKTTVTILRFLLFAGFLILWEAAARLGWIEAFIFSSPTRIAKWLWTEVYLNTPP